MVQEPKKATAVRIVKCLDTGHFVVVVDYQAHITEAVRRVRYHSDAEAALFLAADTYLPGWHAANVRYVQSGYADLIHL